MRLLPSVIKASQYAALEGTVAIISSASARVNEAEVQKKQLLREAEEEAARIRAEAKAYSERVIEESRTLMEEERQKIRLNSEQQGYQKGFEKGRADGYAQGVQEGNESLRQVQGRLADLVDDMETQKGNILKRFSADIQKLAVEIARKIMHRELDENESALADIVKQAMEEYRNQDWVKLTIPQDVEQWASKEGSPVRKVLNEVSDNVKIEASSEMKQGDCLIDLPEQLIDAGVETQLSHIKSALKL